MAGFDWDYWRHKYVSGSDALTLEALSLMPNAPSIPTLKRRSTKDSWAEQRKQFRYQVNTQVASNDTAKEAIAQTEKLIDAAEIITRHMKLARSFQDKLTERLKTLNPEDLRPGDLATWLKVTTDIERLANGLATEKTDLTSSDRSLTPTRIVRVVVDPKTSTEVEY